MVAIRPPDQRKLPPVHVRSPRSRLPGSPRRCACHGLTSQPPLQPGRRHELGPQRALNPLCATPGDDEGEVAGGAGVEAEHFQRESAAVSDRQVTLQFGPNWQFRVFRRYRSNKCFSEKPPRGQGSSLFTVPSAWHNARRHCNQHGVGRRVGGGAWLVSKVALAMFLDGDESQRDLSERRPIKRDGEAIFRWVRRSAACVRASGSNGPGAATCSSLSFGTANVLVRC
jgi:hypothetical protein